MSVEIIPPDRRVYVPKPWGWEDWILNDETANFCQKVLFIKGGHGGSIHMHPIKDEVMTCESGCLIVEYLDRNLSEMVQSGLSTHLAVQTAQIHPGMAIRFRPGQWHRLFARFDTYIYEASTFHRDDDVRRVEGWGEISKG